MIYIESKRKSLATINKKYPSAIVIDVTSKSSLPYIRFSPFFPLGNIPIPFSDGFYRESIEGIWQGLKVFKNAGIDITKFSNTSMKNLKRSTKKYGIPIGHQRGVNSNILLTYLDARKEIYLRSYAWVLENKLQCEILLLRQIASKSDLVLLDYEVNEDIYNINRPLSHAALIKRSLLKQNPEFNNNLNDLFT